MLVIRCCVGNPNMKAGLSCCFILTNGRCLHDIHSPKISKAPASAPVPVGPQLHNMFVVNELELEQTVPVLTRRFHRICAFKVDRPSRRPWAPFAQYQNRGMAKRRSRWREWGRGSTAGGGQERWECSRHVEGVQEKGYKGEWSESTEFLLRDDVCGTYHEGDTWMNGFFGEVPSDHIATRHLDKETVSCSIRFQGLSTPNVLCSEHINVFQMAGLQE